MAVYEKQTLTGIQVCIIMRKHRPFVYFYAETALKVRGRGSYTDTWEMKVVHATLVGISCRERKCYKVVNVILEAFVHLHSFPLIKIRYTV